MTKITYVPQEDIREEIQGRRISLLKNVGFTIDPLKEDPTGFNQAFYEYLKDLRAEGKVTFITKEALATADDEAKVDTPTFDMSEVPR